MLEQFKKFEIGNPHAVKGGTTNAYFGREHGNSDGIPPDGEIRTNWGVYPHGD